MPLKAHPRPPELPIRRHYDNSTGNFYVANVYEGPYMQGVKKGSVKYLRVVESPEKRTYTGPAWEGQGQQAPAMSWHDFNNKRILGTAPVEEDGSAYFSVPSDAFVYFQLLDEQGMMIQSMRSGTMIQAGETQGCIGCHEDRRTAAPEFRHASLRALERPPTPLSGWHGPARNFCFLREVQPVFDRYCVSCHDYKKEAGDLLNLAGDRDLVFNTSFNELWRKKYIAAIGGGPAQVQPAYSWGARSSRLIRALDDRIHRNLVLDKESMDRLVSWIDINAPYYAEYESAYPDNLAGRSPLNQRQIKLLSHLTGMEFSKKMGHQSNEGPMITFERPELSPCLQSLRRKERNAYRKALALITEGAEQLNQKPNPDKKDFLPCPQHQLQLDKYMTRRAMELHNRLAITHNELFYDIHQ
jgi:hypothetical protein